MSAMGGACQACKSRHIKCDERLPECQQCIAARRVCYRVGSVIHIENAFASRRKKRPRGPRTKPVGELRSDQAIVTRSPSTAIGDLAIAFYIGHHFRSIENLPSILKGQTDDVLRLLPTFSGDNMVHHSLSCIALTVASRTQRHPGAAVEASMQYQMLLQTARTSMASITRSNFEACLLTIFLMGRYEDSIHRPTIPKADDCFAAGLGSVPHHEGALAVMKSWKDHLSPMHPPSAVVKHMRRGMIRSAVMRNQTIPDWMMDGLVFGENGLELGYDSIMTRIMKVRYQFFTFVAKQTNYFHTQDRVRDLTQSLDQEAQNIDIALKQWSDSFPDEWNVRCHHLRHRPNMNFFSCKVHSYSDHAVAAIWCRYHALRMLVNSTRMRILREASSQFDSDLVNKCIKCLADTNEAGNNLAASIPFALDRFSVSKDIASGRQATLVNLSADAYPEPYVASMIIWPLTIASSLIYLDDSLKSWFRSQMAGVGKLLGSQVFEAAETGQWLEL